MAFCTVERNHLCSLRRRHYEKHLCDFFYIGPVVQEMSFKDISYLELWQHICLAERNHLCTIGRVEDIMGNIHVILF